jgi:hypothetical protein
VIKLFQISQLAFAVISFGFAFFQVPVIKALRDYVPINNPYNRSFHNRGVLFMALVGAFIWIAFGLGAAAMKQPYQAIKFDITMPFLLAAIRWLIFDVALGAMVYGSPFYLGHSARLDRFLRRYYEEDAGKLKVVILSLFIILLNILTILL